MRRWTWEMGVGSGLSPLSALSCPPFPPGRHSTLCTLCTNAPFPVVLWQYTQLCLPCSASGDLPTAQVLGLLLMFQTDSASPWASVDVSNRTWVLQAAKQWCRGLLPLQIFEKGLEPPFCNGVWHLLVHWYQVVSVSYCHPVYVKNNPSQKLRVSWGGGVPPHSPPLP